ncbi:MAG: ATP-binding protein [Acidobacteriota bacterium]
MALLLGLAIANVVMRATLSAPDDGGDFRLRSEGVVLERGTGDLAGVPPRARLLGIDEQVVKTPGDVARALEAHRIGDVLTYHFQAGRPLDVRVAVRAAASESARYVPLFALSLLFWLVAAATVWQRPVPAGVMPVLIAAFLVLGFGATGGAFDTAGYLVDKLGRVLLGPAAIVLALSAGRTRRLSRWLEAALLAGPPLAVAASFIAALRAGANVSSLLEIGNRAVVAISATGIVAATGIAAARRSGAVGARRDVLRWTLMALGWGALPFALTTLLPLALVAQPEMLSGAGALFLVLVPLAIARSLDLWKLATARRQSDRFGAIGLASITLGGLASIGLLAFADRISRPTPITVGIMLLAAAGSLRLAGSGERLARRMRLGNRVDLQTSLPSFGEELMPLRDPGAIARRAAARLFDTFRLEGVAITAGGALIGESGRAIVADGAIVGRRSLSGLDVELLAGSPAPVRIGLPRNGAAGPAFGTLSMLLVPAGDDLDIEDLGLLSTFALLCFRAVENALLFAALQGQMHDLERLSQENAQVIEASAAAMLLCLPDGRVKIANRRFLDLLGLDARDVEGTPADRLLPAALLSALTENGMVRHKVELAGKARVVEGRRTRLADGGSLLTLLDVTLEALLEETMRERERLSDMGVLTAQVAHEVATPLTGVSSYAQLLGQKVKDDPALSEMVRKIQGQAERASEIARSVLGKVRPAGGGNDTVAVLDAGALIREIADVLSPVFAQKQVTLLCEAGRGVLLGNARRGKIEQVLVNLMLNARDASACGTGVRVEAERRGAGVAIRVIDQGTGIDPKVIDRIFDPYFTTKESGTGLGLFVARRLVTELGGALEVRSVPGEGTTMEVLLPGAIDESA